MRYSSLDCTSDVLIACTSCTEVKDWSDAAKIAGVVKTCTV